MSQCPTNGDHEFLPYEGICRFCNRLASDEIKELREKSTALIDFLSKSGLTHTKECGKGTFVVKPIEYSVVKELREAIGM